MHSAFATYFHPVADMFRWDCKLQSLLEHLLLLPTLKLGMHCAPSFRFLVHTKGRQLRLLLFGFAIATTPGGFRVNSARSPSATTRFARHDRVEPSACKDIEGFQKRRSIMPGMRKHVEPKQLEFVHQTWCYEEINIWIHKAKHTR